MKKIKTDKRISKEFVKNSTKDDVILAELLLLNVDFLNKIDKIRKRRKIKPNPNYIKSKRFRFNQKLEESVKNASRKICNEFGLTGWLWTIEDFILSGKFTTARDNPIMGNPQDPLYVQARPSSPDKPWIKKTGIQIVITNRLSKSRLHELIDKEWPNIEYELLQNTKEEFSSKIQNLAYYKEILELKDKKRLTFEQIADELAQRYMNPENPETTDMINAGSIKTAYHRIKRYISSVGNR